MHRRYVIAVCTFAAVASVAAPALAKHKKPVTKTYSVTAPAPDPTNQAGLGYEVCAMNVPQSFHSEPFKATEPGTIKVEMSGYQGDWDLLLIDDKGRELSSSGSPGLGDTEKLTYKVKKKTMLQIIACNYAGGPTANVKYTYTYR